MSARSDARLAGHTHVEDVQVSGHIIDSLILPKILDLITAAGGAFRIKQISIGQARSDPSFALIEVQAPSDERLHEIRDLVLRTLPRTLLVPIEPRVFTPAAATPDVSWSRTFTGTATEVDS